MTVKKLKNNFIRLQRKGKKGEIKIAKKWRCFRRGEIMLKEIVLLGRRTKMSM